MLVYIINKTENFLNLALFLIINTIKQNSILFFYLSPYFVELILNS